MKQTMFLILIGFTLSLQAQASSQMSCESTIKAITIQDASISNPVAISTDNGHTLWEVMIESEGEISWGNILTKKIHVNPRPMGPNGPILSVVPTCEVVAKFL